MRGGGWKPPERPADATARFSRTGDGGFSCSVRVHAGRDPFFDGSAEAAKALGDRHGGRNAAEGWPMSYPELFFVVLH
jgi:hypothetical protein